MFLRIATSHVSITKRRRGNECKRDRGPRHARTCNQKECSIKPSLSPCGSKETCTAVTWSGLWANLLLSSHADFWDASGTLRYDADGIAYPHLPHSITNQMVLLHGCPVSLVPPPTSDRRTLVYNSLGMSKARSCTLAQP
jgi:hypothetical protein